MPDPNFGNTTIAARNNSHDNNSGAVTTMIGKPPTSAPSFELASSVAAQSIRLTVHICEYEFDITVSNQTFAWLADLALLRYANYSTKNGSELVVVDVSDGNVSYLPSEKVNITSLQHLYIHTQYIDRRHALNLAEIPALDLYSQSIWQRFANVKPEESVAIELVFECAYSADALCDKDGGLKEVEKEKEINKPVDEDITSTSPLLSPRPMSPNKQSDTKNILSSSPYVIGNFTGWKKALPLRTKSQNVYSISILVPQHTHLCFVFLSATNDVLYSSRYEILYCTNGFRAHSLVVHPLQPNYKMLGHQFSLQQHPLPTTFPSKIRRLQEPFLYNSTKAKITSFQPNSYSISKTCIEGGAVTVPMLITGNPILPLTIDSKPNRSLVVDWPTVLKWLPKENAIDYWNVYSRHYNDLLKLYEGCATRSADGTFNLSPVQWLAMCRLARIIDKRVTAAAVYSLYLHVVIAPQLSTITNWRKSELKSKIYSTTAVSTSTILDTIENIELMNEVKSDFTDIRTIYRNLLSTVTCSFADFFSLLLLICSLKLRNLSVVSSKSIHFHSCPNQSSLESVLNAHWLPLLTHVFPNTYRPPTATYSTSISGAFSAFRDEEKRQMLSIMQSDIHKLLEYYVHNLYALFLNFSKHTNSTQELHLQWHEFYLWITQQRQFIEYRKQNEAFARATQAAASNTDGKPITAASASAKAVQPPPAAGQTATTQSLVLGEEQVNALYQEMVYLWSEVWLEEGMNSEEWKERRQKKEKLRETLRDKGMPDDDKALALLNKEIVITHSLTFPEFLLFLARISVLPAMRKFIEYVKSSPSEEEKKQRKLDKAYYSHYYDREYADDPEEYASIPKEAVSSEKPSESKEEEENSLNAPVKSTSDSVAEVVRKKKESQWKRKVENDDLYDIRRNLKHLCNFLIFEEPRRETVIELPQEDKKPLTTVRSTTAKKPVPKSPMNKPADSKNSKIAVKK